MRKGGRIVPVAAIIAVAISPDGRREIVGLGIGPSEAEPFWSSFIKGLVRRGLTGVKRVISEAHDGLRLAIARVLGATWQRCRVHWMRNALAHVPKGQHTMVAAAIRQAFRRPDAEAAHNPWRHIADQLRARWPKLAALRDDSEHDTMLFPALLRRALVVCAAIARLDVDAAYHSAENRRLCAAPGLLPLIRQRGEPHRSGLGTVRYVVEHANAWLLANKRLDRRNDRLTSIIDALLTTACIFVIANRLTV